jgi:broad specificity phosphatase PhoE
MLNSKSIYSLLSIIFCGVVLLSSCNFEEEDSTVLYLVRHAEKDTTDKSENPPLIEEGYERAQLLLELLGKEKFSSILSTPYDRNINTVLPLATQQGLTIQEYEWYNWHEDIDQLKTKKGTFLVCGHGDNLIPMITHLNGLPPIENLGHNDYSNIFKVTVKKDTSVVEWMKF